MTNLLRSIVLIAAVSFVSLAAGQGTSSKAKPLPALEMLKARGYEIGTSFDAGHGLKGWVVSRGGQANVVYTTDGGVVLIGALVNGQGEDLTAGFLDKYTSSPGLKQGFLDLQKLPAITVGTSSGASTRSVWIVFDPNCPYCSLTYRTLKQYANGQIQFKWVPVAYLRPDSAGRAEAILASADPAKALDQNETGFDAATHQGGVTPAATVSQTVKSDLSRADASMHLMGLDQVPAILWTDDAGHLHHYIGLPPPDALLSMVGISTPH